MELDGMYKNSEYNPFNGWKCLLYKEHFEGILKGEFLSPVTLHIYPTNRCPAKCAFCIMKEEKEQFNVSMKRDTFINLIDSANQMGIKSIHVSGGGEPTVYKYLDEIKHFRGLKVLSTNGAKLTPLVAKDFDRIRISLNAGTKESHEKIMGMKNWDQIWENILNIKCLGEQEIGIGFVLDHNNWKDIHSLIEQCEKYNVDFIHIRPAYYPKGSIDNELVKEIIKPVHEIVKVCQANSKVKIFSVSDKFTGFWTEREYDKCLASPLHCVVSATAELIVCQDVFIRFGDLNKQVLQDVWGSDEHKKAISKIDIDTCPRCVMNKPNEIMENVFIKNNILKELI